MAEFPETGLWLVLSKDKPKPEPTGLPCRRCGKRSAEDEMPTRHCVKDGFTMRWPVCDHGRYLLCKDCSVAEDKTCCPVCDCGVFYI